MKEKILTLLIERVAAEIEGLNKILNDALSAATHEESRPENQYDTRSVEASYLAAGQGQRIESLRRALSILRQTKPRSFPQNEPVQLGALVETSEGGKTTSYFICPVAGGYQVECDGKLINVITPESRLGQELLDKVAGDEVEFMPGSRVLEIIHVC